MLYYENEIEKRAIFEGLKEKCPIKMDFKIYFCGQCEKCNKPKKGKK